MAALAALAAGCATPELAGMVMLQRGSRLPITPTSEVHWRIVNRTLSRA